MTIKKILITFLVTVIMAVFAGGNALAIPSLQLYIEEGTYVWGQEESWTIDTSTGSFTLSAFALDKDFGSTAGNAFAGQSTTAYLVAALTPKIPFEVPTPLFGDLLIGSDTENGWGWNTPMVSVTTIEQYEQLTDVKVKTLPTHGIFPTYYLTYEFEFGAFPLDPATDDPNVFDTQPDKVTGLVADAADWGWRRDFVIDLTGLNGELFDGIHFDLYTKDIDDTIHKFAPFSHDASTTVPEPATMLLLGTGLVGLAGLGRRKLRKS